MVMLISSFITILLICLIAYTFENQAQIIELIPTTQDIPQVNDPNTIYIPIFHSNDVHGTFFPQTVSTSDSSRKYESGGLEYMGKYISIMRNTWGDRFKWLDSGDQFQGGLESTLSFGEVMSDFYNKMGLTAATIGNHEFDYGQAYLAGKLKAMNAKYIAHNLKFSADSDKEIEENIEKDIILTIEGIKIGIIGLATIETETTTSGDLTGLKFENYASVIFNKAAELRKDPEIRAIILLAHIGGESEDKSSIELRKVKIRDKDEVQSNNLDSSHELSKLMSILPPGTVDAVFGGHKHSIVHHWINGTPCSINQGNGETASIMYLAFDRNTKALQKDKIKIEGPLPICQKIFIKNDIYHCRVLDKDQDIINEGDTYDYSFHGVQITKEESLKLIADKYISKVNEYEKIELTKTDKMLERSKEKENALGNLFCDLFRRVTGADISVVNAGSFRKIWAAGVITRKHIYEMVPFNNSIVSMEMTGTEVIRMMYQLQEGSKSYYPTAGIKQVVTNNIKKLVSLKLFDGINESEIDPLKTYTVAGIDFCFVSGGDDFAKVLSWYKPRNLISYGELKIHTENWLKDIPNIKVDSLIDPMHPRMRVIKNPPS